MVLIAVAKESDSEPRVAISPETVKKFSKLGATVKIEAGAGARSGFTDEDYKAQGADIVPSASDAIDGADILLAVARPPGDHVAKLKKDGLAAAILSPFDDKDDLKQLAGSGASLFSMEFMPRITRAQSMDVLSSQANLAGYKAVIDGAAQFGRALPMMMTAAGTVPAAKVFIMGVGVAGLQAIATARRMGAVVTATDVRPDTKEQVQSLGAKFVAVEDDEFREAQTAAGYAKAMSESYQAKQAELISEHIKGQDIVITTALIPGRPAPQLISDAMVKSMKSGSVIVDLAAERGGNCAATKPGETVEVHGVLVSGPINLASKLGYNASSLYAKNLFTFIETMIDKETGDLAIAWDDEIITGTLVAKDGAIVHPQLTASS